MFKAGEVEQTSRADNSKRKVKVFKKTRCNERTSIYCETRMHDKNSVVIVFFKNKLFIMIVIANYTSLLVTKMFRIITQDK